MPQPGIMDPGDAQEPADLLQWALPQSQKKVVLVLDLVESVRLMASDELGTVRRWMDFAHQAEREVIPAHQGRLVKSLGDGLMVEFDQPRHAVAAAFRLHGLLDSRNAQQPPERHMRLRAGIHASHVYSGQLDIYGAGVNLTSRLASLAAPGETIVSANVRDSLSDVLDADVEDLGDCYLKHVEQPVRAYRVAPTGSPGALQPQFIDTTALQPTVSVIPFEARSREPEHYAVGELIADAVIAQLSRTGELNIISRLSSTAFRHREATLPDIAARLGANYVLSGSYIVNGGKLLINVELAATHNNQVVWADRLHGDVQDLLQAQSLLSHEMAQAVHKAVLQTEVKRAQTQPLPTLHSYSLMLSGLSLMHRSTARDFDLSRRVLELLVDRHRTTATGRAWLAMWYVLKTTRGLATDPVRDAAEALDHTQRALDADAANSLALAMEGFVFCHLKKDPDTAARRMDAALAADPSNSLAWLFMTTIHSLRGQVTDALACAERAMSLSPLDPLRYYYLCLAGGAAGFAEQWERSADLLQQSWRLNRSHLPTVRGLVIANAELGRQEEARLHASELLRLDPAFTVQRYLSHSPGGQRMRARFADALGRAGLPHQ